MDAPFGGRMGAVECLTVLIHDVGLFLSFLIVLFTTKTYNYVGTLLCIIELFQFTTFLPLPEHLDVLHKWLEEERIVDLLTRDNLHNQSYVERYGRERGGDGWMRSLQSEGNIRTDAHQEYIHYCRSVHFMGGTERQTWCHSGTIEGEIRYDNCHLILA